MKKVLELIDCYDQIVIYRHINPDLDAFGSQLGLYFTLKELFPFKTFVLGGNMNHDLLRLYDQFDTHEVKDVLSLGVVVDTANKERIDGDISICDKLVKIDHHIVIDSYGNINIEYPKASSCSEIVTLLLKNAGISIPLSAAKALYLGIVGDSNRFLYNSTSSSTFSAASYLLDSGISISELYESLYLKKKKSLKVLGFIYSNYKEDSGVAWYYLSSEDLKSLDISREEGSNYVNALADIEDYKIWVAITQNDKDGNYRVSIRSRGVAINEIANQFRGGGHANASGATLNDLSELPLLIDKLKEKINE